MEDRRRRQWDVLCLRRKNRRCICSLLGLVAVMYGVTFALLLILSIITFFCGKEVWFAKGGILATYMVVGCLAGICRRNCKGLEKWLPLILYLGIWYVIMLGTGKNGAKDFIQLAIITVIVTLSFLLGSIFHKY